MSNMRKKVLIVDDEPSNLNILKHILKDDYDLIFAINGEETLEAVSNHSPDLILLDIMMQGMSGYEVCEGLQSRSMTQQIPVIFVTAMSEVYNEVKGFDVGAVDYINKPVSGPIVLRRVKNHLSLVKSTQLEEITKAAVSMLCAAVDANDGDTSEHIKRVTSYAKRLAVAVGWNTELAERLEVAAEMHDTGKIGIPDSILKADRKLTNEEMDVMKTHSEIGKRILSICHTPLFTMAAEIAHSHHEKWDGSGYPQGLAGQEIPESARITSIADVFDALTTRRVYKSAWTIDEAIDEIKKNSGSAFEPRLVDAFINILPEIMQIKDMFTNKSSIHEAHIN